MFCILLAIALYVKFYYDTKHLNNLKQLLEKSKYDDAFAVNVYKKYIKNHPLSIYNDTVRTLLIPPSITVLTSNERVKLIKNNRFCFTPNNLNDFILFCCFILKENNLETEYDLLIKRISSSKSKKSLCYKIKDLFSLTINDEDTANQFESVMLESIAYFNTAVKIQGTDTVKSNDFFKKCFELCGISSMKRAILNRGGKIE